MFYSFGVLKQVVVKCLNLGLNRRRDLGMGVKLLGVRGLGAQAAGSFWGRFRAYEKGVRVQGLRSLAFQVAGH